MGFLGAPCSYCGTADEPVCPHCGTCSACVREDECGCGAWVDCEGESEDSLSLFELRYAEQLAALEAVELDPELKVYL
jgi:hypothetical protein